MTYTTKLLIAKGVCVMYESYDWPGAYSLKDEFRTIIRHFREMLDGVLKEIKRKDKFC